MKPTCCMCKKPLESLRDRARHFCKQCRAEFPRLAQGDVRVIPTKDVAHEVFRPRAIADSAETFVGRHDKVRRAIDSIRSGCLLVGVLGERRVGKSSLLGILMKLLKGDAALEAEYEKVAFAMRIVHVSAPSDLDTLADQIVTSLLSVQPIFPTRAIPAHQEHEIQLGLTVLGIGATLRFRMASHWAKLREAVLERLQKQPHESLRLALALYLASRNRPIIFVDEVHTLREQLTDFGLMIRSLERFEPTFCVAGNMASLDSVYSGHSSLRSQAAEIYLDRFSLEDTRALFGNANYVLGSYLHFDEPLVEAIFDMSLGIPALIQIFGAAQLDRVAGKDWPSFASATRIAGCPAAIKVEHLMSVVEEEMTANQYVRILTDTSQACPEVYRKFEEIAADPRFLLLVCDAKDDDGAPPPNHLVKSVRNGSLYLSFDDPILGWHVWARSRLAPGPKPCGN